MTGLVWVVHYDGHNGHCYIFQIVGICTVSNINNVIFVAHLCLLITFISATIMKYHIDSVNHDLFGDPC